MITSVQQVVQFEDVAAFRDRAEAWLRENLPRRRSQTDGVNQPDGLETANELERINQRRLFDVPYLLNFPTLSVCAPTIVELGTDAQKDEHLQSPAPASTIPRINHAQRRQTTNIGGGTTELARNVLSERLLGTPRELAADRDVSFGQLRSGRLT